MKDVFYGILSFLLIAYILFVKTNDAVYEFPATLNGVVIDKASSYLVGDRITILKSDSTTEMFICYDILFDAVQTKDTIINGKIQE